MGYEGKERVKIYIENVNLVLKDIKNRKISDKAKEIVELVNRYLQDSKHYLEKGDVITSLACVSYAEGLLDALRIMGYLEFEWPKRPIPLRDRRVVVGGVFDLLHPGHLHFLRKASEYGRLIVVVARDNNVKRIKGHPPIIPEEQRLEMVKGLKPVDEAILGEEDFDVKGILKRYRPDYVVLGPDQDFLYELIVNASKELGIDVKVIKMDKKTQYPLSSTSNIVVRIVDLYKDGRIGIRGE
mgnify:CR=1 FL=1